MIKNTKNENILWTSRLVKEKEFNWDFVNGKKFNEITFFFN